jgi:hypothetical protein
VKVVANRIRLLFHNYFEAGIWIIALVVFALMSPTDTHASLCPFNALDLGFCPGCGIGHSISWLFHGDVISSFKAHPLGWFAVIMLLYRIITLLRMPGVTKASLESSVTSTLPDNELVTNQPNN